MKITLSKSQWQQIGKKAQWLPQDPSNFSDQDLDAIYTPDEEEIALQGEDDIDDNYAYKSGFQEGLLAKQNNNQDTTINPYRVDTPEGQAKFDQWMLGFKEAIASPTTTQDKLAKTFNLKTAQSEEYKDLMDLLDEDNPAKIKPAIHLITKNGILVPKTPFDTKKLYQILRKIQFNPTPDSVRDIAKKLWEGTNEITNVHNSKYDLLIDGMGIEKYIDNYKQRNYITPNLKTASGWDRFSKDLSDVLEAQVMINKNKNREEIFNVIKSDPSIVEIINQEEMNDEDLMDFISENLAIHNTASPTAEPQKPDQTVALTILQQLGGNKFVAMTGAKNLTSYPNALSFKLPGSGFTKNSINYVKITLDPSDTYTMEFSRTRGSTYKIIETHNDIYFDVMQEVFTRATGLHTHF